MLLMQHLNYSRCSSDSRHVDLSSHRSNASTVSFTASFANPNDCLDIVDNSSRDSTRLIESAWKMNPDASRIGWESIWVWQKFKKKKKKKAKRIWQRMTSVMQCCMCDATQSQRLSGDALHVDVHNSSFEPLECSQRKRIESYSPPVDSSASSTKVGTTTMRGHAG